jgi:hypothetical protein
LLVGCGSKSATPVAAANASGMANSGEDDSHENAPAKTASGVVGKWTRDIGVVTCKLTLESGGRGQTAWGAETPYMTFKWHPTADGFTGTVLEVGGDRGLQPANPSPIKGELGGGGQKLLASGIPGLPDGEFTRF